VLSRKTKQQIVIGRDVSITVLEIIGHRVKIGIAAPKSIQVLRGELAVEQPSSKNISRSKCLDHSQISDTA
jgi:carbon storage regulator